MCVCVWLFFSSAVLSTFCVGFISTMVCSVLFRASHCISLSLSLWHMLMMSFFFSFPLCPLSSLFSFACVTGFVGRRTTVTLSPPLLLIFSFPCLCAAVYLHTHAFFSGDEGLRTLYRCVRACFCPTSASRSHFFLFLIFGFV